MLEHKLTMTTYTVSPLGHRVIEDPLAKLAVVSYTEKTVRSRITCTIGFGLSNYYVDCDFEEDGEIDLLIFYFPPRYK